MLYLSINELLQAKTPTGVETPIDAQIKDNPYACLYRNYTATIVTFIIRLKNYTNIYNSLAIRVALTQHEFLSCFKPIRAFHPHAI